MVKKILMAIKKIFNICEELKLLGFLGAVFRLYYEFSLRTGLKRLLSDGIPRVKININLNEWRNSKQKFFLPSPEDAHMFLNSFLSNKEKEKILKIADDSIHGKIICFSKWIGDYGYPINWHFNPMKKVSWPNDVHWSKVMKFEKKCGDIKLAWEINRFPQFYYMIRAYVLTFDNKYIKGILEQIRSWKDSNTYGYGINWSSGQELAIRSLAWIFALYMIGDNDNFTERDFQNLLTLLYLHAYHIEKNINYAYYAVHNNHLIGEALALYVIGTLFPYFKESKRWRKKGKDILQSRKCLKQFYADGGYCQSSFNYQRLALHYYLWALRIAELNGDKFKNDVFDILKKSLKYLYSFMDFNNGYLPNWGTNDGALLNPWTSCDYRDYRPLISSLSYVINKNRIFSDGLWDEELFWLFGSKALNSSIKPFKTTFSCKFEVSGLHVLRFSSDTFATLRCGSLIDRFGQADQLHVDLWWRGLNIAVDGGSYLYNDELQYHKYFMGTSSHNTVVVDNKDQMLLFRRFKWLYWTKAKLLNFSDKFVEGEHYGYEKLDGSVIHKRRIEILNNGDYLVEDNLYLKNGKASHIYDLHWLLNDFNYTLSALEENIFRINLQTSIGKYYIFIGSPTKCSLTVNKAFAHNETPDGWQSPYYGEKIPALSVHFTCSADNGIMFFTLFTANIDSLDIFKRIMEGGYAHTANS